jgi:FAD/FMN-containing dehydrogenase
VTSFGAGTSFGGALSNNGGICISFEKMKALVKLNEDDMDCIVQPGLGWVALNDMIKNTGLFFPVDPAPAASIGGMIAMSCSGTNAYRYGTMKEWVISLTCVLADGRIVATHKRPRKSAAGYDLTHLLIGSEGTLGLVTEAVLRLARIPGNLHVGIATFDTFQAGVNIVVELQKSGHKLEALELADGPQMHCLNHSKLSSQHFPETPTLFFKIAGPSEQVVRDQIEVMKKLCHAQNAKSFDITNNEERIRILWGARKAMGTALVTMKSHPTDLFIHSDCAVPISNLPALVAGTHALIAEFTPPNSNWFCANVGHVGDGNVHSSIVCPAKDKKLAEEVIKRICRLALSLEGTVTGEHGVGLKLRDVLVEEVGEEGVGAMRAIKRALDERGILNPGKVVRLDGDAEGRRAKL